MNSDSSDAPKNEADAGTAEANDTPPVNDKPPKEVGGRGGLDPTRYGDWEKAGRCVDF
jgi:hypothetical protein